MQVHLPTPFTTFSMVNFGWHIRFIFFSSLKISNRPGVAGAVLQKPFVINSVLMGEDGAFSHKIDHFTKKF